MDPLIFADYTRDWLKKGYAVVPLEKMQYSSVYQSSGGPCDTSKPWTYKVAIGNLGYVADLVEAYEDRDDEAVGKLLEYPPCCTEFFKRVWIDERWIDTSLPMASYKSNINTWSPYCNILLRWLGLRLVSHLPCDFNCEATKLVGQNYRQLAYDIGYRSLVDTLYDLLSKPLEWSGLHGIGLVTTPYLRVEFRTDMLSEKHVIKLISGDTTIDKPLKITKMRPNANGFFSEAAETLAHNLVLDLVKTIPKVESVIDLGCGDMKLLDKIGHDLKAITVGVDSDVSKKPTIVADIYAGDYFYTGFDVALVSVNRITENYDAFYLLAKVLEDKVKYLVIYSYDGKKTFVSLDGFEFLTNIKQGRNSAALYRRLPL